MAGYEIPPTRRGYDAFTVVSAMQKAIRRSQVKEATYWAMELWCSGHETWAWNRLQEITSEDIGHADRYLPATIAAIREVSDRQRKKGKGGGAMEMCHAVVLLATAEKSGLACWLVHETCGNHSERFEIPDEALDMHTRRGRRMRRGPTHFAEHGQKKIDPDAAARAAGFESMDDQLRQLEVDGLDHWRRACKKDPTLPDNPKAPRPSKPGETEPAQISKNPPRAGSEQLTMEDQ